MQRRDFKGIFSIRTWKVLRSQCKETWKPLAGSPVSQPPSHTTAAKSYTNTLSSSLSQLVKIEINTNPPDSTNITVSTSVWVKHPWHGTKQGRVEAASSPCVVDSRLISLRHSRCCSVHPGCLRRCQLRNTSTSWNAVSVQRLFLLDKQRLKSTERKWTLFKFLLILCVIQHCRLVQI